MLSNVKRVGKNLQVINKIGGEGKVVAKIDEVRKSRWSLSLCTCPGHFPQNWMPRHGLPKIYCFVPPPLTRPIILVH